MTDIAYRCHNCGSVHEAESIRQNLVLDRQALASYEDLGRVRRVLARRRAVQRITRALWRDTFTR